MSKITKVFRVSLLFIGFSVAVTLMAVFLTNENESLLAVPAGIGVFVWFAWIKYKKSENGSMLTGLLLGLFVSFISFTIVSAVEMNRMNKKIDRVVEENFQSMLRSR